MAPVISVCGYGPGIASSVAARFGKAGFKVALLARNKERLATAVKELESHGVTAAAFPTDLGNAAEISASFSHIKDKLGPTTVLFYNAVYYGNFKPLLEYTAEEVDQACKIGIAGLVNSMRSTVPDMEGQEGAAVLVTGGGLSADEGAAYAHTWNAQLLAIAKASQHSIVVSSAPVLKPKGIHVAELAVQGAVDPASPKYSPDLIAEEFLKLYKDKEALIVKY